MYVLVTPIDEAKGRFDYARARAREGMTRANRLKRTLNPEYRQTKWGKMRSESIKNSTIKGTHAICWLKSRLSAERPALGRPRRPDSTPNPWKRERVVGFQPGSGWSKLVIRWIVLGLVVAGLLACAGDDARQEGFSIILIGYPVSSEQVIVGEREQAVHSRSKSWFSQKRR